MVRPMTIKTIDDTGTFSGYGSVFDVLDSYNDIVEAGAFAASIDRLEKQDEHVRMLWQHNWDEPIGTYPVLREDDKGLYFEGELVLEVQRAREAQALMKHKAVRGMSIGYVPKVSETDRKTGVTTLKEVDLWEISVVTFPANPAAKVVQVRSIRDFERMLTREAGFSRSEAQVIINQGFKALEGTRDAADDETALKSLIENLTQRYSILSGG